MNENTLNIIHHFERIDREELMMRELAEQEIYNYHIWPAIFDERAPFAGISMAHKRIVRHAKQNKYPYVIIAEDDLRFTARGAYKHFISQKPEDYDIYLASVYTGDIQPDNTVADFSGFTLYIMAERFYDAFLNISVMNHCDRSVARMGRFVVCNPFTCYQFTTYSQNKQSTVCHTPLLKGRKLWNPGKVSFSLDEMLDCWNRAWGVGNQEIYHDKDIKEYFKEKFNIDISDKIESSE